MKPSLRVSIPLDRLPNNFKENTDGNISMASDRLIDAQLLVAFSNEAREKVSSDSEIAARTPDDLGCPQPSQPKAAKLGCINKYTQTEGRIGELIEIIETNKITRRQLLRLVGQNDQKSNSQTSIEIEEHDETLLEEIKSKSDQAKQLLLRTYNGVRPGNTVNLFHFINGCLVDKSKDGDKIVEIVDNSTLPENENDKDQEEINGNTAAAEPYNDTGISTERLPANTDPRSVLPVSTGVPTGESARALPVADFPSQQMTMPEYMACLFNFMSPVIKNAFTAGMRSSLPALLPPPPPPPPPLPPTASFNEPTPMSAYRSATSYQLQPNLQRVSDTFNAGAAAGNIMIPPRATNQPMVNSQPSNIGHTLPPSALPAFNNVTYEATSRAVASSRSATATAGSYAQSRQPTPQSFPTSSGTFQPVLPRESWNSWQNYMQQRTTEQPSVSKPRRGWRTKSTPVRGVSQQVPPSFQGQPYDKYKYMMGQQRAWQSQFGNYPNNSWGWQGN